MQVCKGCYKPNVAAYCPTCRKQLYLSAKINPNIPFQLPERDQRSILASYNRERSLNDVKIEYTLQQNGNKLELTDGKGTHILKPAATGSYERLSQLPANEHLTMQIARQVFNINVAPNGMVSLKDNNPAYITRRFDIETGEKISIASLIIDTEDFNYSSTVEDLAQLLKLYVPSYMIQAEHLLKVSIFNYLFSNANSIIHSFFLVPTEYGDYILSPAFNMLCTSLHDYGDVTEQLFTGDDQTASFRRHSFYTHSDFRELAALMGIVPKRVDRMLVMFMSNELIVDDLISRSFLDAESRFRYSKMFHEKLRQLKM